MPLARAHQHVSLVGQAFQEAHAQFFWLFMLPGCGALKKFVCIAALIALLLGLYKAGVFDNCCRPGCCNIRRCPGVKRLLMRLEYDEFEQFGCNVFVHSVKDIKSTAAIGKSALHASVSFWFEEFSTAPTKDGKWEQSAQMVVPQGADECLITLHSKGLVKTETVGTVSLSILHDIKNNPKASQKKFYKLMQDHNAAGQIAVTFVPLHMEGGRISEEPLLENMEDNASPALVELIRSNMPDPSKRNVGGKAKFDILSKCLCGTMDRLGGGLGGPKKLYFATVFMKQPDGGQKEKWLWCWYESSTAKERAMNDPQGCFALIKVTSVNRSLKKKDEWSISFQDSEKKKQVLSMKSSDRDVDIWVEGFEMIMRMAKEAKLSEKDEVNVHNEEVQDVKETWHEKTPDEKWEYWETTFRRQGLTDDQVEQKRQQFLLQQAEGDEGGASAVAPTPAAVQAKGQAGGPKGAGAKGAGEAGKAKGKAKGGKAAAGAKGAGDAGKAKGKGKAKG